MNTMVVQLFDGGDRIPSRHASDKALLGYCGFHHLLLQVLTSLLHSDTNPLLNETHIAYHP